MSEENRTPPPATPPGKTPPVNEPGLLTIEEHRGNLAIEAPVFAAVMQAESWESGKKIPEAVFIAAVKKFLKGSMGGK
jgi:hypothetical protein